MSNNMYTVFTSNFYEIRTEGELYVFTKANNEADIVQL
jgi:hypothetical protein